MIQACGRSTAMWSAMSGVGRADADVDHGDAAAVGAHQVVGRAFAAGGGGSALAQRRLPASAGRPGALACHPVAGDALPGSTKAM